jgi:hypothetical protein
VGKIGAGQLFAKYAIAPRRFHPLQIRFTVFAAALDDSARNLFNCGMHNSCS